MRTQIKELQTLQLNIIIFTLLIFSASISFARPPEFKLEISEINKAINCKNKKLQMGYTTPKTPLYICEISSEDYLDIYINDKGKGELKNSKILWDDRTQGVPLFPPVHSKKNEAKILLSVLAKRYMPSLKLKLIRDFFTKWPLFFFR